MGNSRTMMARAHPTLGMRPLLPADVPLLREIFRDSIEELTSDDYTVTQQEAWAAMADDEVEFGKTLAGGRGADKLTVDASDSARGFFEKRGYQPQQRNTITMGEEWLANTTLSKQLAKGGVQ